jgi:hypothetical protein
VNYPSRWIFGVCVLVALIGPGSACTSTLIAADGTSLFGADGVVSVGHFHPGDHGTSLHRGHNTPGSFAAFAHFLGLRCPSRLPGVPLTPDGATLGNLFQFDSVRRM